MTKPGWRQVVLAVFLVGFFAVGMTAAAVTDDLNTSTVDDPNTAPNPFFDDPDFEKAQHPMTEGASHQAMSGINDDDGDFIEGEDSVYEVNTSSDTESGENVNPYTFNPAHIDDSSYTAFPTGDEDESFVNDSVWADSADFDISETSLNQGVEAVRFDTGSSGDTASDGSDVATTGIANWDGEFDSDEERRVLMIGGDVDTLDANARVYVNVTDESGDEKPVMIDPDEDVNDSATIPVIANETGSFVAQIKLDDIDTQGAGDFDNIESVNVTVVADGTDNANADVSLSWLDLRKKSKVLLGEEVVEDDDGDWTDTEEIYQAQGDINVSGMDTLDNEFDDATINDVAYPVHLPASAQADTAGEDEDYVVHWEDADDYPGFDHVLNLSYRMEAPAYIDASYGDNMELRMMQKWPEGRYLTLEVEEGADGANFSEIDGTSQLNSLGTKGDELDDAFALDETASSDTEYLVHYEMTFTEEERNEEVENGADDDDGDAVPPPEDSGGDGILGFGPAGDIAALLGTIGAFLAGIPQRIWRATFGG